MGAEIASWLSSPAWSAGVYALGWTLLDVVWQAVLIALVYGVLRTALGRASARARLAVGYLALMALALAPMITFALRFDAQMNSPLAVGDTAVAALAAPLASHAGALAAEQSAGLDAWLPWMVGAWLLGVVALSARALWQWRSLHRLCRQSQPVDARWERVLAELRERLGIRAAVSIRQSVAVAAPMLVGWIKPVVLLPAALCTRLPADQVELLIAHELAHVRRFDYLANLMQIAVETVLFYHPAVHWISRRVREDREQACDELVTAMGGDRLSYARALLALAEDSVRGAPTPALAATGGALLARVERIVGQAPRSETPANAATPLLTLVAVALVVAIGGRMMADDASERALAAAPLPALSFVGAEIALPAVRLSVQDLFARAGASPRPAWRFEVAAQPDDIAAAVPTTALAASAQPSAPSDTLALAPPPVDIAPHAATATETASAVPAPSVVAPPLDAAAEVTEDARAVTTPVPRVVRSPDYPRRARLAGTEGFVTLSYAISPSGRVVDVQVEDAMPPRVFDQAAVNAIEGWRFDPATDVAQRYQQTFDFRLAPSAGDAERECVTPTGTRICRLRP